MQALTFGSESGNLQTVILIQVVTNLFEHVENLLGLPGEFRISSRKEEPRGLFGQPGFMDIARPIMRKEEDGDPHYGQGGISCLRKYIKKDKTATEGHYRPIGSKLPQITGRHRQL